MPISPATATRSSRLPASLRVAPIRLKLRKPPMLSAEQNELMTRTGPGTGAGALMRRYWQPAALVDELAGDRPVKPVRLLGEAIVAFKDDKGRYGRIARRCP